MEDAEIMRRVSEARPHVMLVCFGCPKQEKWIWRNFGRLRVPVAVGAGATVDFLANRVARAPEWMRRSGTEWVFRLLQEPRRLAGRYADDILHFLPSVLRQAWWQAKRPRRAKPEERP
jgi:exopolysaccharide biosynthesis WecB/TagA/CpsF family protein